MRKVVVAAGVGNALEWFDWVAYAVFAPFFAVQMFNPDDPVSALLSTLAVFAVGFLMRPLGGLFFGWFADRAGRRKAMVWSMIVTALGSVLIGVAPTYEAVGVLASLTLLFARLMQGFGLGGEIGGSYTYLAEMAPPKRRGLWTSTMYISVTCGSLGATVLAAVLTDTIGTEAVGDWGWRVPFIVGGLLGVYAIFLRRGLDETPAFEEQEAPHERGQLLAGMKAHWRQVLAVVGLSLGPTVVYYTWSASAPAYAISVMGVDATQALWTAVLANIVFIIALPIFGALSDRWGRKPNVVIFSVGMIVLSFPLDWLMQDSAWQLGVSMSVALIVAAAIGSIIPALLAELFPTHIRAAGFAFPNSVAVALAGGTAPYLKTWLAEHDVSWIFTIHVMVMCAIGLVTIAFLRETKGISLGRAED